MNRQTQLGFTLLELMVGLLLLAIVTSIAAPGFSTLLQNNRLVSGANVLLTAFNYARSEAAKRNTLVRICGDSTPDPTTLACDSSIDWSIVLVYLDRNSNSDLDTDANCNDIAKDCVLRRFAYPEGVFSRGSFQYNIRSDGRSQTATDIYICDNRLDRYKRIKLGYGGRPRVSSSIILNNFECT